jgi:Hypothetical protein (DUF2513)
MKIDQDYLKGLLEAFENAEEPTTDIEELQRLGFNYEDDKFIFHLQILADRMLVEGEGDNKNFLGYEKGIDGYTSWGAIPLRLTANGHDFIEALHNKEVWETIKSEFKYASIGTLIKVSKELLEGYAKKKIAALME